MQYLDAISKTTEWSLFVSKAHFFLLCHTDSNFLVAGFWLSLRSLSKYSVNSKVCLSDLRLSVQFSSVKLLNRVRLFATPWMAARQASLSITSSQSLPKLMSIESVMPSNHLILCRPLLLLTSIFPSIRVFSNESALQIRWPKYWSFSFNFSPSNEHPGLISFRIDWLDLLVVQGTLKSLLQHHSSKASIIWLTFVRDYWKNHSFDCMDLCL